VNVPDHHVDVEGPGGDGLYGLGTPLERAGAVIVPVPYEATVSYGAGTARGPAAVLEASDQVDLFDLQTGEPHRAGIAMLDLPAQVEAWSAEARPSAERVIAGGGVDADPGLAEHAAVVDACSERVNAWVRATVEEQLEAGRLVGVLGGDHSVPFGAIAAHAARSPGLGILHVDAHADLRKAYEGFRWSHASILYNVREHLDVGPVVGVGYRDLCASEERILREDPRFFPYHDPLVRERLFAGETWGAIANEAVEHLPEQVYVTFDIDGLDPALCPNTGTPVPGGLSWAEACSLLQAVVRSGRRIVGFDLVEVSPPPEGGSEWDANVGARLLYKLIGFALQSRSST
jgi:agmatinase